MDLLPFFGCTANHRNDYSFTDANSPQELASREAAALEFRQFYDELKKIKDNGISSIEHFHTVIFLEIKNV